MVAEEAEPNGLRPAPPPNRMIHHRGWGKGGAILCGYQRSSDIAVPVGGMYDPSGGEQRVESRLKRSRALVSTMRTRGVAGSGSPDVTHRMHALCLAHEDQGGSS